MPGGETETRKLKRLKPGIVYLVVNTKTGKEYVGQTRYSLKKRRLDHELQARKGEGHYFQKSIRKYGAGAFRWYVLHRGVPYQDLCRVEKMEVRKRGTKYPNGYNLTDGGEGLTGYTASAATRKKISRLKKGIPLTPEHREKVRLAMAEIMKLDSYKEAQRKAQIGRKHSEETKAKIGTAHVGRVFSQETRARMSASAKLRPHPLHTEETKAKIAAAGMQKSPSLETREKIAATLRGRPGRKHSEETKAKIKKALLLWVSKNGPIR